MDNDEIVSPIIPLVKGKKPGGALSDLFVSVVLITEVGSILAGTPHIRPFVMID